MYFGNVKRFYSYCITLLNITCSLQEQPCLKLNREGKEKSEHLKFKFSPKLTDK